MKLLVANRAEIAVRIIRAAHELGIECVAVFAHDEADALHIRLAEEAYELPDSGPAAYLDIDDMVAAGRTHGCTAVHPGYGFLSENADFARAAAGGGMQFVGPDATTLDLFGDKARARGAAVAAGVPVLAGSDGAVTLAEAEAFLREREVGQQMIIKAVSGGGGRGMRVVADVADLADAFERCQSEALAAFGSQEVYVEQYLPGPRHIEVQVVGDGTDVIDLGERDCSVQRRHQKILEYAPAPELDDVLRSEILAASRSLASSAHYRSLGTFEFLVDSGSGEFAFIEANARLQVEHTVTEAVTGVDLVAMQLLIAQGRTLSEIGLSESVRPRGMCVQARVNLETITASGEVVPTGGTLQQFDPPGGPGVRVDTFAYGGYTTSLRYDSLLAKVVVHTPQADLRTLNRKALLALSEFRIGGVETNIPFLQGLLAHEDVNAGRLSTTLVDRNVAELSAADPVLRHIPIEAMKEGRQNPDASHGGLAGAAIDASDPLAVLDFGRTAGSATADRVEPDCPDGSLPVTTPLQGTVVTINVALNDRVAGGQLVAVMESMKMEHEVRAPVGGRVVRIDVEPGDALYENHTLLLIEEDEVEGGEEQVGEEIDPDFIRPDLAEAYERHARTRDQNRPDAVAKRHGKGLRTARENIEHLCDTGTFVEYGPLVIAAQRSRHSVEKLMDMSPADGFVCGVGRVNGDLFGDPDARCVVMSYDYTVFAGTQGVQNHRKIDRMVDVAANGDMPMIIFAEGGGGRPGDEFGLGGGESTWARFPTLSGQVPMVGVTTGRCFAGNASLLGCCDVIIATEGSNIGMGGPAMIEGGGLGIYAPEDIGPTSVQVASGVIDLLVEDEAAAVETAKRYLSYFQGPLDTFESHDQRMMRHIIPENRLRVYEVRDVIDTLADIGSVLELRPSFGVGMITSLIRVEGRPMGVIANNPHHLGGAIDSDAADKGARFMQLCDAYDLPLLYLCDTPGIMVGPEIEHTGLVRHSSRMFIVGANISVPFFTIVLRKAYGLGAIAMAAGSYKAPYFTVAWPTGEFGGMGLEGAVKLGYRKELEAIEEADERLEAYEEMVAREYDKGKAVNNANTFDIDDTIDPADSRWWVSSLLASVRQTPRTGTKKGRFIDAW